MQLDVLLQAGEVEQTDGNLERAVAGLAYDSRRVKPGFVFFAIPGARSDGREFVNDALTRGAAAVVAERPIPRRESAATIRVRNVRRAMGQWSARFYDYPSRGMRVAGVTGTNGKTTVTYILESIFRAAGAATGVVGTVNYRYRDSVLPAPHTTPESVDLHRLLADMARAGVESVAMEVSSHALELERVRGIDFDAAIFTNLTRDHLDFHGDMEHYFGSKSKFFTDYLPASGKKKKSAVIHGSDPRGPELLQKSAALGLDTVSYGRDAKWDVHPVDISGDLDGLRGKLQMGERAIAFSSQLIGATNLENILAAAAAAFAMGIEPDAIARGLAALKTVPGRLEKVDNDRGVTVLVDYAHTPDALERALKLLKPLTPGRLIAVFGCGGDRDRGKRPLMGEAGARLADVAVLTSDNPRTEDPLKILEEVEAGAKKSGIERMESENSKLKTQNSKFYLVEPDRRAAIRTALSVARAGDLVLLAGKGHEDYQILGTEKIHFDDREVAKEEMEKLSILKVL
ncbi:MAG TPA: UDP-N-acetylmuramoyl-L-alanyl-D-glutamate--2,6-diaminopimelate ligase [Candidatus Binatia bacterium]|jgi:UDP-N-acetylmuramoyl-L-alanyl-D-glutamate--2,6-diaminopimelate ligase